MPSNGCAKPTSIEGLLWGALGTRESAEPSDENMTLSWAVGCEEDASRYLPTMCSALFVSGINGATASIIVISFFFCDPSSPIGFGDRGNLLS